MARKPIPLADDRKTDYFWVDSRKLKEAEGYNERERWGDIPELAASILAVGVQQALIVNRRKGEYIVRSGNRRRKACELLVEQGHCPIMVPVILERQNTSEEMRVLHLLTDNSGLEFTPWEKAKTLARLRNFAWPEDVIVEKSGLSVTSVRRLLSLYDAPQKLINLVREGRVSATEAMDTIAEGKVDRLLEIAQKPTPAPPAANAELFDQPDLDLKIVPPPPTRRITKSDIRPNSWKIFKKWAPSVEEDKLPPVKLQAWNLIIKIRDGEATEEDFKQFFS